MKGDIIRKYLSMFPNGSSSSIARMLVRDEPLFFHDVEVTRRYVIMIRKQLNIPSKPMLPQPIKEYFGIKEIKGTHRVLILSDIHIPFHDKHALEIALNNKEKYDLIILNGDIIDCYALSKWEKDPRKRFFSDELKSAISFLQYLRSKFKKSRIIYKFGNHEERHQSYIFYKAPELYGIDEISLSNLLQLPKFGIESLENKEPIKLNELFILHGHEYKGGLNSPINPARGIFMKTKKNTLIGHFHQPSTHQEPTVDSKFITCWSTGCLCDLHPKYMPLNKWALGYAVVETYKDREFNVVNKKIIGNKVFNT